jgi:hypothetical protein
VRRASLTLVGDPDQLPPVRPGQPVADALAEGMLPCIDLRQIYRTAANSAIVTSAHAINRGEDMGLVCCWAVLVVQHLCSSMSMLIINAVSSLGITSPCQALSGVFLVLCLAQQCSLHQNV